MKKMDNFIDDTLLRLQKESNYRELKIADTNSGRIVTYQGVSYINLCSNDYLGLGGDLKLQQQFLSDLVHNEHFLMSNSASRLMSGNGSNYATLEQRLSAMYQGKSVVVLGNGYVANSGVLPALTSKNDLIVVDRLIHASVVDGMLLAGCEWKRFRHNDMDHLESILKKREADKVTGDVWVVVESIYSMDGDRAPLIELVELKRRYGFKLYLDEAHSFGVEGSKGEGCAVAEGLSEEVDVLVATFGKALCSYGAFVALGEKSKEMLVNRMRPLIYSTALPPVNLLWTEFLVSRLDDFKDRRERLQRYVKQLLPDSAGASHIIPIMAYESERALWMAEQFKQAGYWVTAIRPPTVPQGEARVRVSLSASLEQHDMDKFIELCSTIG